MLAEVCFDRSEVFAVEDTVAFAEDFISLLAEVVLFANVAHIEELFVVLLKEDGPPIKISKEGYHWNWPPDHFLGHVGSPHANEVGPEEAIGQ